MSTRESLIRRARKYLESARLLCDYHDFESSTSRAYYAMFFSVQALLLTKQLSFSSHKGVLSAFGQHFVKTGVFPKVMSKQLNLAFEKRQLGDYESSFVIEKEEAVELLGIATQFVDKIVQFLDTQPDDTEISTGG